METPTTRYPTLRHTSSRACRSADRKKDGIQKSKKERKTSRAGAANYSDDDVEAMLNIVEDIEPLGANNWSEVASQFCAWTHANSRPARNFEFLRNKFDKLANAKKKTGDPSCPPSIRRAKQISRAIQAKCAAYTLGDSSEEEKMSTCEEKPPDSGARLNEEAVTPAKNGNSDTVGAVKRKRRTGATGTPEKGKKAQEILLEHVGAMAEHIGWISEVFRTGSSDAGERNSLKKEDVVEIVQREVGDSIRPTNDMLGKIMDMMRGKGEV